MHSRAAKCNSNDHYFQSVQCQYYNDFLKTLYVLRCAKLLQYTRNMAQFSFEMDCLWHKKYKSIHMRMSLEVVI